MWMLGFDSDKLPDNATSTAFLKTFKENTGYRPDVKTGVLTGILGHVTPKAILTNKTLMGTYLNEPSTTKVLTVATDERKYDFRPEYIKKIRSPAKPLVKDDSLSIRKAADFAASLKGYMAKIQKEIHPRQRNMLVGWMLDMTRDKKASVSAFVLSVAILDAYLSLVRSLTSNLQAIGCIALSLAYEVEGIDADTDYFVDMSEGQCSKVKQTQIRESMVQAFDGRQLDYKTLPNAVNFLDSWAENLISSETQNDYARYAACVAAFEYDMVKYSAAQIAAACVILGKIADVEQPDLAEIYKITGIAASGIKSPLVELSAFCYSTSKGKTNKEVYDLFRFNHISMKILDDSILEETVEEM